VHESTILSFSTSTCIAHPCATPLHDYWAVYDPPPPTSRCYAIHHTRLIITIWCKGQLQAGKCCAELCLCILGPQGKKINRSHTHTDREQHPRHRHTRTRQAQPPNPPNEHLAQKTLNNARRWRGDGVIGVIVVVE